MTLQSTIKLDPSKLLRLDELSAPMQISEGSCNLFLVQVEQGGLGARSFVRALESGDAVFPIEVLHEEGMDYVYALVAVDAMCAHAWAGPAAGLDEAKAQWLQSFTTAISEQFGRPAMGGECPYRDFLLANQNQAQHRLHIAAENRAMTKLVMASKVAHLGAIASIKLEEEQAQEQETDRLFLAMQQIGQIYRLPFERAKEILLDKQLDFTDRIQGFCESANWRFRKVILTADFYQQSSTPLLVFTKSTQYPLIVFPSAQGSHYIDPEKPAEKKELNAKLAADIDDIAYLFYELLPDGALDKKKLVRFVFANAKNVLLMTIFVGLISSILGLVSPVATAYITSKIIPTANLVELWQITALLIVLLACQIVMGVVPSLITMIFSSRQFERFQAAVFDHILRIPVKALRNCDSGDMTQRVLGATQIQSTLFQIVSQQFLSSIFALSSLVMMFYYSKDLSLVGLGMVLVYAISFFLLMRLNLKPLALQAAAVGRVSGLMKQFFDGISKIRSAGAEDRVLSRFMDDFSIETEQGYKIAMMGAYQAVLTTVFPMIISLVFYAMAGGLMENNLAFPIFLAFMAAFQNFQGGVMGLAGGLWTLLSIKPEVDRVMPLLQEPVEDNGEKVLPGQLNGEIEISHLNFRYNADGPLILQDVSLHAKQGEFVAIVGASGAGKSTLVRLLLGFEKYDSGAIYYSGKELVNLNLRAVRRQLGVILQNSRVMPASIMENISTGTEFGEKEVFEALKLAAYDDDVRALPMGVHTLVTPSNISGGQQQRILIARALIGNPVAVIMDESTSALDNAAQQIVKNNMEALNMTRIVIAHRLSTIINADRIYVLDKGRVVAHGTYHQLLAQGGVFKDLVTRQQLSGDSTP